GRPDAAGRGGGVGGVHAGGGAEGADREGRDQGVGGGDDPLAPAEHDVGEGRGDHGAADPRADAGGGVHGGGDVVGLDAGGEQPVEAERGRRRHCGQPLPSQAAFDVVGDAAPQPAVDLPLVDLGERRLDEREGGADQRHHRHPDQGAGAAGGDGGGHPGDVADADPAGQGQHQRLEGGDAL